MNHVFRWGILASALLLAASALAAPTKVDPKKFKTTKSGLKYAIITPGKGKPAKAGQHVTVHYTGWLASNGEKFDSSVDRKQPFDFDLGAGGVIKGWDEGVEGMLPGQKRQLIIPAKLGYGATGTPGGPIPGNATLIFDVQLIKAE
jgi:FKBP-type peptidyl-prolyl cis-trans isomerase